MVQHNKENTISANTNSKFKVLSEKYVSTFYVIAKGVEAVDRVRKECNSDKACCCQRTLRLLE